MTNNELEKHLKAMLELRFGYVDERFDRLEDEIKSMKSRYDKLLKILIACLLGAGGYATDFKALSSYFISF